MNNESSSDRDRWRELADLLGVPNEGARAAPPPPPPRSEPYSPAESAPPAQSSWREPEPEFSQAPPELRDDPEPEAELPPADQPRDADERATGSEDEGRGPRRGRRRRGRGGRGRPGDEPREPRREQSFTRDAEPVAAERDAAGPMDADAMDDDWERAATAEEPEAAADLDEPLDEELAEDEDAGTEDQTVEDDDEDLDTRQFADWNVPSWNELVDSLYRPDR